MRVVRPLTTIGFTAWADEFRPRCRSWCREGRRRGLDVRTVDLGAPADIADLRELEARLRALLAAQARPNRLRDVAGDVVCDVGRLPERDARVIDGLARLQLIAHRSGFRLVLAHVSPGLHELLALAGLCDIVGCPQPTPRSSLEAQGQAEEREPALGVQEEGDAADPIA